VAREGHSGWCFTPRHPRTFLHPVRDGRAFVAFSTNGEVDIVEYPDRGKVAIAVGIRNAEFARTAPPDYFEGEGKG
jgi:hypothetical protein